MSSGAFTSLKLNTEFKGQVKKIKATGWPTCQPNPSHARRAPSLLRPYDSTAIIIKFFWRISLHFKLILNFNSCWALYMTKAPKNIDESADLSDCTCWQISAGYFCGLTQAVLRRYGRLKKSEPIFWFRPPLGRLSADLGRTLGLTFGRNWAMLSTSPPALGRKWRRRKTKQNIQGNLRGTVHVNAGLRAME
jgi:hypothetical protein